MRPSAQRGPDREQRIMEQDQAAIGAEADVGLQSVDRARQCPLQCSRRGVQSIGGPEAVRVDPRQLPHAWSATARGP